MTNRNVKVCTIDGAQGEEADICIISLVRCNKPGSIGFLANAKRVNVMLTRGRCLLVVIGSYRTISSCPASVSYLLRSFENKNVYQAR
jgi:ATP-dependent RNA/DNA helicase IGHMBP2